VVHFLIKPVLKLAESAPLSLEIALPLAGSPVSRYQALFFFIPLFLLIFGLSRITPRFWCRYLCPAGALFGLVGGQALFRRRVSQDCIDCGLCQQRCPMQAIDANDPRRTAGSECMVCQRCVRLCPVQAISFQPSWKDGHGPVHLPERRAVLQTVGLAGLTVALGRLGLEEHWPRGGQGQITPAGLIRPPGAVPENDFLNLCLRCGLCFKVCPTNMLQPAWLELGLTGLSSPLAVPRWGPCEPECAACGRVCPSGAIRELPLREKQWAKMGTASITPSLCLAWEFGRSCLVCDEACPYGAIHLKRLPEQEVAVPFVNEDACTGCGYCEHACPVTGEPAIAVTPMGALRLREGSYRETGRRLGLSLDRGGEAAESRSEGLSGADQENGGLPPGFSP
jgi:MauM/NapG family ferredoxin protein